MSAWARVIDDILRVEGEAYTDHPADRGGPTKWGITLATLRGINPRATAFDVRSLTREQAFSIYESRYVTAPGFGAIGAIAPYVAVEVIDTGVNCGPGRAGMWLQRALNAFNGGGKHYADIGVDGKVGPATINALRGLIAKRGQKDAETVLLRALNALQGVHYLSLGEAAVSQRDFMFGWFKNRVS